MSIDQSNPISWQVPTRKDALNFWWRSTLLVAWHGVRNVISPKAKHWPAAQTLNAAPILSQRRAPLWADGRSDEFPLIAGKVQNLRVARSAFHGIEIPAGETFSFWKQLGRPTARRGFVEGREVREGCVVPTLAGGICQISNALATATKEAGFEFVERHAHSALIENGGSDIKSGTIDATVFWNYIDLKLRAPFAWRLELEMSADELILTIRANANAKATLRKAIPVSIARTPVSASAPVARGCLTCDQHTCFRHRAIRNPAMSGRTALLLDAWTPEFAQYLQEHWHDADYFVPVPARMAFWRTSGKIWGTETPNHRAKWASWQRALWLRLWSKHAGGRRQSSIIDGQRWLAQAYARHLRPEHTALVVDQGLLPHLARLGVLGGRRITVLAHSLPMQTIQERLDAAAKRWPQDTVLRDFRADSVLLQTELHALKQVHGIVTAHTDVAARMSGYTPAEITMLPWVMPASNIETRANNHAATPVIVFPSSVLSRKGARELAAAMRGLDCSLHVIGARATDDDIFAGLDVHHVARADGNRSTWLDGVRAVVLPAHVEHQPRALLQALAVGIPVVATAACGIGAQPGLHLVEAGNAEQLRDVLVALLNDPAHSPQQSAPGQPDRQYSTCA